MLWQLKDKKPFSFVWVGGRSYEETPPGPDLRVHWHYGHRREVKPAEQRLKHRYLGFQSNNFVATKEVLLQFPFPEDVAGYGHEDTLWGQQLEDQEVWLFHINNPVIHLGLETNEVFLRKQREAIRNLTLLHQQSPHLRTRLIDLAKRYPLVKHLVQLFPENWLIRRLTHTRRPSFYWLDLLKLKWWFAEA
jgi:hypothetical protein